MNQETSQAFQLEEARLAQMLARLDEAIAAAERGFERQADAYADFKRYMSAYRDEIDPAEKFQNERLLRNADATSREAVRRYHSLRTLRSSPYFARLDFRADDPTGRAATDGRPTAVAYYIGRQAFQQDDGLGVIDWRAPLGGLYYEAEPGRAEYEAPAGRVAGDIELKRQIKIEGGRLRFVFDTDEAIRDEALLDELGRTSDAHMRSIVATIQRDQNAIIRAERDQKLVIQGVAGSGKSSIALHRVAYLLYRGRGTLRAENIAVVSPTRLFSDYIARVLPELGEEAVVSLDLPGIARAQLPKTVRFAEPLDPADQDGRGAHDRAAAKSTFAFHEWLVQATDEAIREGFEPREARFGQTVATTSWLARRFAALAPLPVAARLRRIADDLAQRHQREHPFASEHPTTGQVLRGLRPMFAYRSSRSLYRALYQRDDAPAELRPAEGGGLEWADVYPCLYVRSRFEGLTVEPEIRHLVVDEMQDHSPTQYAVLAGIYDCGATILGDVDQALGTTQRYETGDLAALVPGGRIVRLTRSYRSSIEIMEFAGRIRGEAIAAVERHGDRSEVLAFDDDTAEVSWIASQVRTFQQRSADHPRRMAVLARTRRDAERLRARLFDEADLDATGDAPKHPAVQVLALCDAKGLEFDEVIVPDASDSAYGSQADRARLYVACTRALHRLTLTHVGAASRWIEAAQTVRQA